MFVVFMQTKTFIKEVRNDPLFKVRGIISKHKGNLPYITKQPTLQEFSLPTNIEEIVKRKEKIDRFKNFLMTIINITLVFGLPIYLGYVTHSLLIGFAAFIVGIFLMLYLLFNIFIKENKLITRYKEYEKTSDAYWSHMKHVHNWTKLSGHDFEYAFANLYEKQGYNAKISKIGPDQGIDIILEKNNELIAVQCKNHSKPVGVAVIRDLYGTMAHFGYQKGMLTSLSGYTQGVYDFAMASL